MQPAARVAFAFSFCVLFIVAPAALGQVTATKSVSGTFVQGTNVTYTITLTNNKPFAQPDNYANESVDVLPSGVTYVSAAATSGTLLQLNNVVTWNGEIPSGGSVTYEIVALIDPAASGTISNQAYVYDDTDNDGHNDGFGLSDDPSVGGSEDPTSFNVIQSGEVLATKSVSGTFVQGTDVTYTIAIANNMTIAQPDNYSHEFTDVLPSGLTLVSVSADSGTAGSCCGDIVFWDGVIPAGGTVTLTVVATISPTASGTISNQGQTIFDRDGDNLHNESSHVTDDPSTAAVDDATSFNVIQSGEVSATMAVSGTFVQGTDVTYTVVMTNNMTVAQDDLFGHEWTDILPAGLTFVSATATSGTIVHCCGNPGIVFWDGSIPSGGSVTLTFTATISSTASGTISNQGQTIFDRNGDDQNESSHLTDDPSTAAVDDATSFNVIQSGEVTATMSVSGTFVQGTDVTYTVVITNNMTVTQDDNFGNEFANILPDSLELVSGTATSGTLLVNTAADIFTWNGSIPAGGTVTITAVATISATATGTISNQGNTIFDRDGDDFNESVYFANASFNAIQANEVLSTMSVSGTFVQGTNVTYTVVMTNNMTVTQDNLFGHEWTDILPSGLTLVPATFTASSGTIASVSNIVFWDGSIPSGGSVTLTFSATIGATASGTKSNQGQTIFNRDGNDSNESSHLTDDPSTAAVDDATSFNVIQSGEVTATMSVSGTFVQGTDVTYTVVITNNMTVAQNDNFGNEFADILPDSLELISGSATSGTLLVHTAGDLFTWNGSIPAGGTVTITAVATISSTATGTILNQGNTIFDRDSDNFNESVYFTAASFDVIPAAGLVAATKSVSGSYAAGTDVTYTIVLTNNMDHAQPDNSGDELVDNLPPGLTLVSATATSGTVLTNTGASSFTWNGSLASGASVSITAVATIDAEAVGTISNQASFSFDADNDGDNENAGVSNDALFTAYAVSDLALTMTYLPSIPGQSSEVTYTVEVTNNGASAATNVVVTDDLPDDADFVSSSATQGSCSTVDPMVCSVGNLLNGASATITIVVQMPSIYDSMTNTATATADQIDPTPTSASATFNCMKSKKGTWKPCR